MENNLNLTEEQQKQIAWHYVCHTLARRNHEATQYAPQWIKLRSEQNGLIILDAGCTCMGESHNLVAGVEYDKEYNEAGIHFWTMLSCYHDTFDAWQNAWDAFKRRNGRMPDSRWDEFIVWLTKLPGVVKIMYKRFKSACKLFFTGYEEWEGGITFTGEKQVSDMMLALWWSLNKVQSSNSSEDSE